MSMRDWLKANPLRMAITDDSGEPRMREAAKKLGVSRETLHSWCIGRYLPRTAAAVRIEEVYHLSAGQLLAWYKSRPRQRSRKGK